MTQKDYLSITPEIQQAIDEGKPVVALESTILSHGMPFPQNVEFGQNLSFRYMRLIPLTSSDEDSYGVSGFGILE